MAAGQPEIAVYDLQDHMPGWLHDFLRAAAEPVIVAALTAAVIGFVRRRRAQRRLVDLQIGKSVTFDASLRANTAPYPRRWGMGWLTVNAGPPTWRPGSV